MMRKLRKQHKQNKQHENLQMFLVKELTTTYPVGGIHSQG